ncbi:MAG: phenylalanine--tRNA ligase subunit beta [Candidatus Aenigmarchaeota archaeon]|nr:phenylalanine--tRNA ligase subunit beta [Candidatus Aenigmarchaeota archaeon]
MPKIEINIEDFFNLLGKRIEKNELEKIFEYAKSEVEEISNEIVKIEIKDTNRPDLWSTEGLARELRGRLKLERGLPKYSVKKSNYKVFVDSKLDRTTVCAVVENVKLNSEALKQVIQIQEKIATSFGRNRKEVAIGVYDKDKINFPLFFIGERPENIRFVPLDFDKEMNAIEILEKHPKGIEYRNLLEGKEKYPIFVDSKGKIISMPPIINSDDTKVTENTKNVFIECSGTNNRAMELALIVLVALLAERKGAIRSVEVAKIEFERFGERIKCISCGSDKVNLIPWLGCVYECKSCGAKLPIVEKGKNLKIVKDSIITPNTKPKKIIVELSYINKISGLDLKLNEIKNLLLNARYEIKRVSNDKLELLYPCYRFDIMHQRDVVEDILISYGFDNIPPKDIKLYTIGSEIPIEKFKNEMAEILIGLGFQEIMSYMLTSKKNLFEKMNRKEKEIVEIENPISENWSVFRDFLVPSILEFISLNQHVAHPQKIFEIGTCVILEDKEAKDIEKLSAAISDTKAGYEDIAPCLDAFLRNLKLKYELIPTINESFIEGRVAKIVVEKKEVGIIGELNPYVLEKWNIVFPVAAFEINVNEILSLVSKIRK